MTLRNLDHWPGDWIYSAACRGLPAETFFGADQQPLDRWAPQAKAICARCDVAADCLAYALRTRQQHGVWGGTDPEDRALMPKTGGSNAWQ